MRSKKDQIISLMKRPNKKNILITGGAGFIGSVLTFYLKKNFNIYVIDDLSIGRKSVVRTKNFVKLNILNKKNLNFFFQKNRIDIVIHLAGHSNLRESQKKPQKYINNNIIGTKVLIDCIIKHKIKKVIFSSTASVYGSPKKIPILETSLTKPISIYGKTKLNAEKYIINKSKKNFKYIIFRFFNIAGALTKAKLGEIKNPPAHFIPIAIRKILSNKKVIIFNKFNTKDGSGLRDYIHVKDVAKAHQKAISYLNLASSKSLVINLGSKKSISTIELVDYLSRFFKKKIEIKLKNRKHGEPDILNASFAFAKKKIKWFPREEMFSIIKDSIWWEKYIKKNKLFR